MSVDREACRSCGHRCASCSGERQQLLDEIRALNELRDGLRALAVTASESAERALKQLQDAEPVILAADELVEDPNSLNKHFALHAAVEAWRLTRPS